MYRIKVLDRLACLTNPPWDILLSAETILVSSRPLKGLPALWPRLLPLIAGLYNAAHVTIIHGDFQFANILHDLTTGLIKVIDPRGSFGPVGRYGDCKYDFAKLLHSIDGYNCIVNDLFSIEQQANNIAFVIHKHEFQDKLVQWFERKVAASGFRLCDIRLIEGLLFLSMIPLHSDQPKRQLAMFAMALQLLNNLLGGA